MRPNVDIPDSLHGEVKEYTKQENTLESLDQAYIEILERGLQQVPIHTRDSTPELQPDSVSFTEATAKPGYGLNSSLLFSSVLNQQSAVKSTTRQVATLTGDDMRQLLSGLQDLSQNHTYPPVIATFSQVGGEWYVGGAKEILQQFMDAKRRWESQPDWEKHHRENVTIVSRINDNVTLFIGGQTASEGGLPPVDPALKNPWLSVITDGYPVTGGEIKNYATQIGFPVPTTAESITMSDTVVTEPYNDNHSPVSVGLDEVVSPITYMSGVGNEEPWVCGATIKNPFNRPLLERLFRTADIETDKIIDSILARDTIVSQLLDTHPYEDGEVEGYKIERIRVTDFTEATAGRSGTLYNLGIELRYITEKSQLAESLSD